MAAESSYLSQEPPPRSRKTRTTAVITATGVLGVLGCLAGVAVSRDGGSSGSDIPPAIVIPTPLFPPSVSTRPSLSPTDEPGSIAPPANPPVTDSSKDAGSFCDTKEYPTEGTFDQNTGTHTLFGSIDHQSIAVVTPERSALQQLRWKLPKQDKWITFDPGSSAGILVRAGTDMEIDTGDNRAAWYKMCEETKEAAADEVPSRVDDIFNKFRLQEVVVYTIAANGYIVQVVPHGQQYSQDLPYEFYPYTS